MKDSRKEHFEVVHNNVSDDELATRLKENVKHGIPFAKNKSCTYFQKFVGEVRLFLKYKMKSQLGSSLLTRFFYKCYI